VAKLDGTAGVLPLHIGRDELCPGAIGLALEIGAERQAGAGVGGLGQARAIRAISDGGDGTAARDLDRAVMMTGKGGDCKFSALSPHSRNCSTFPLTSSTHHRLQISRSSHHIVDTNPHPQRPTRSCQIRV
jgi:hypothetical protein